MKTEIELNDDILRITNKIKQNFPELLKNIGEMPVKISYSDNSEINIKNLQDYYDSLDAIFKKYATNHGN